MEPVHQKRITLCFSFVYVANMGHILAKFYCCKIHGSFMQMLVTRQRQITLRKTIPFLWCNCMIRPRCPTFNLNRRNEYLVINPNETQCSYSTAALIMQLLTVFFFFGGRNYSKPYCVIVTIPALTQTFKKNHHSIKWTGLQEPPAYHVKGSALAALGAVLLVFFGALKDKDQGKPLIVNVVSMPLWMWSVTWQCSNQVPGVPATISTVWKVPGKRSKTSARCVLSVCSVKKGRERQEINTWGDETVCIKKNREQRSPHPEWSNSPTVWDYGATVVRRHNQGLGRDRYLVDKCLSMEVNSVHVHFVAHSQ